MQEMHKIDQLMSAYNEESELSRITREAADHPVKISRELFDLLSRVLVFRIFQKALLT